MSFLDRQYEDATESGGGRFGRIISRIFENPENPLGWSIKLFTVDGITVRMHLVTIIFVIAMLLSSLAWSNFGLLWMGCAMGSLVVLVVLHEFGHCYACRWVGGDADRIVMLPFGGLALCVPPRDWKSNFITTAGGPAVNLLILPITSLALLIAGLGQSIIFNPFDPGATVASGAFLQFQGSTLRYVSAVALWWVHYTNILLLGFNLLMVMYPFDGGRLLHALLWKGKGYRRATEIAVLAGFGVGITIAAAALAFGETFLLAIAVFGLLACWTERMRLRGEYDLASDFGGDVAYQVHLDDEDRPRGPSRAQVRKQQREQREQQDLDCVLGKIAESGMDSLSRSERALLKRMTKKRRRSG